MPTLFENLKKRLGAGGTAPAARQSQISKVLQTRGGKAGTGVGARGTQIAEAGAIQQATTGLEQQALSGQIAGQQLATQAEGQRVKAELAQQSLASQGRMAKEGIALQGLRKQQELTAGEARATTGIEAQQRQRTTQLNNAADQRMAELASTRGVQLDNIFGEFESSNKLLEDRKDASALEQLGFTLAMRDKEYLDELNRIGRERSLSDNLQYNEEKARLTYGDNVNSLLRDIRFQSDENVKQRDFETQMQKMSAEHIVQLNRAMVKDEADRMMWEAGSSAISASLEYGAKKYYKEES